MSRDKPEIPNAAVAALLDQLGTPTESDGDLVAMLNAFNSAAPTEDGDQQDNRTMQLKVDAAGYAAALQTLATVGQMSLAEFLADDGTREDGE